MENITPPLVLLWDVRRSLEKGQSVGVGIKSYIARTRINEFQQQINIWWAAQSNSKIVFNRSGMNHRRQFLLEILEAGLKGHAILPNLQSLEDEIILSCEDEIQNHIALLPLLSLLPLMFFVFPAMMILLIWPLMEMIAI